MTAQTLDQLWEEIQEPVQNLAKKHLLTRHMDWIFKMYGARIDYIVRQYARYLPYHVSGSEAEDLSTIAQLEFIETVKVWNIAKNDSIWPLARMRMVGAMKDHIRYVTKSDPTRLYDWINNAAEVFMMVNDRADFENSIESGIELNNAMKTLTQREQQIVLNHTRKDLTFKQIGDAIGVSESQVSRIYKKSIQKLKKILNP